MKDRIKNYISFFVIAFAITSLHAMEQAAVKKEVATAQAIAQEVSKDISLLDQIVDQAEIIVNTKNSKERGAAKKELTRLMNHKDLDQKVKAAIEKDIKIIQNKSTSKDTHDALVRLLAISDKMEAEANAIAVAAQSAKAIETASPEELERVVAEAQKNMQEADQEIKEEQGMVRRLYSRAKRLVTAPVDYVFGEESSKAKTAFYAAVGMAATAAIILYGKREYDAYLQLKSDLEFAKNIVFTLPGDATVEDMENRKNVLHDLWSNFALSRGKKYLSKDEFNEFKKISDAVIDEEFSLYKEIDKVKQMGQMDQRTSNQPKGWLADELFKNEAENLPKRFNELTKEYPPVSSFSESIREQAIEYRLNEWEKLVNDLNEHNQVAPSAEKSNMLESAKEAFRALKEEKESFLQRQEALKARYDKDVERTIEERELH